MANPWHINWLKEGVKPWNLRRRKVKFTPDLQGANFYDILPKNFRDAPKTSRFFEKIDLSGANLTSANLSNLNFRQANFDGCNMSEANLDASNFESAKFKNATLTGSTAKRAVFQHAVFTQSDLQNVRFDEADVRNALFIETPLSENQIQDFGESKGVRTIASVAEYRETLSFESFKSARSPRELLPRAPEKDTKYDVFYGTNRQPIYAQGKLVDYGFVSDTQNHYGICEVIIPESHKIGSLGSPQWKRVVKRIDDRPQIHQIIGLKP